MKNLQPGCITFFIPLHPENETKLKKKWEIIVTIIVANIIITTMSTMNIIMNMVITMNMSIITTMEA